MDVKPREVDYRTKVLVDCCNRLLRELITRTLSKRTGFQVIPCGEHRTPFQSLNSAAVDVVVLDSLELFLKEARTNCMGKAPRDLPKSLLIAMNDDRDEFMSAIRAGARGYILQDAAAADVLAAIRIVASGHASCPPAYLILLFDHIAGRTNDLAANGRRVNRDLTRREHQLIPLISRGLTNKEIAAHCNLSECTVKNHVHHILKKLGAVSRLDLFEGWQNGRLAKGTEQQTLGRHLTQMPPSRGSIPPLAITKF